MRMTPNRTLIDHALAVANDQRVGWMEALNHAFLETPIDSEGLTATVAFVATLKGVLVDQLFIPTSRVDRPESGPLVLAYALYIATLNNVGGDQ